MKSSLLQIPGIGPSIAQDLEHIGVHRVEDLINQDPEVLYQKSNAFEGKAQDRCLLYVFRSAVYYASTKPEKRDPELLKWWKWKD